MQPPPPPYQPPPPRKYKAVTKKRGLGLSGHSGHFIASVLTCGMWLPFWGMWWLFRMVWRRKQKTVYKTR